MHSLIIRRCFPAIAGCAVLLLGCPNEGADETCVTGEPSPGDWSQDCGGDFCYATTSLELELTTPEATPLPCETPSGVDCQGQTGGADYTYEYLGGTNFLLTIGAAGEPAFDEASFKAAFLTMDLDLQIEPTLEPGGPIYRHVRTITDIADFESLTLTDDHLEATLPLVVDTVEFDLSELDADCAAAGLDCACYFEDFELPTTIVLDLYLEPF